jgi:hypothetical protein
LGGNRPPGRSLKVWPCAKAHAAIAYRGLEAPIIGQVEFQTVPGTRCDLGSDAARACNRPHLSAARLALAPEGPERRWKLRFGRFPRCTGRLNATQPEVWPSAPPTYVDRPSRARECAREASARCHGSNLRVRHRGLVYECQNQRATLRSFRRIIFKVRLTLRFYCGMRAAGGQF